MNLEIKEICNKLNNLRKEHNPYSDKTKAENIKKEVIELLNILPEGTELGRVMTEHVSYYTSHGGHTNEHTEAHKYKKLENNLWSSKYSNSKDVEDMALSVLYNSTDIMPYKKALEVAKVEKQKDKNHFTSYAISKAKIYTKSEISYPNKLSEDSFIEQMNLIENIFYKYMTEQGYSVSINDEDSIQFLGHGGYATKDDKFAIIFKLVEHPHPRSFSIFAEDRNGYFALDGETAAIYSLNVGSTTTNEELEEKFTKMLKDIYDKYSVYSKNNRLDFVFNELETERKDYTYELEEEIIM